MALVQNNTKAYSHKYATMADIEKQGFKIPKMKTGTEPTNGKDYIFYYEPELKDWVRGAEIVIPETKGMNKAQQYGSAITYARRVTTQMADCLATTDDAIIENTTETGEIKKESVFDEPVVNKEKEKVIEEFFRVLSSEQINFIYKKHGVEDPEELTIQQMKAYIDLQKSRQNEKR